MGHKNDFICWLRLQPDQLKLYEAFLSSDAVRAALNQSSSALAALTVLKKICDHPALLSERAQRGIVSGGKDVFISGGGTMTKI
jgi:SNF2 family DNA or RNA helicase